MMFSNGILTLVALGTFSLNAAADGGLGCYDPQAGKTVLVIVSTVGSASTLNLRQERHLFEDGFPTIQISKEVASLFSGGNIHRLNKVKIDDPGKRVKISFVATGFTNVEKAPKVDIKIEFGGLNNVVVLNSCVSWKAPSGGI